MNVDLVRSFEPKVPDAVPAGRAESGGQGFTALMDSLLRGQAQERPPASPDAATSRPDEPRSARSARPERDDRSERSERAPKGREADRGERAARSERKERSERNERSDAADDRRADADSRDEVRSGRGDEASQSTERPTRSPVRRAGERGRAAGAEDEVAAAPVEPTASPVEVAAVVAGLPEWIALAAGAVGADASEQGADLVGSEAESEDVFAGGVVDALAGVGAVGGAIDGGADERVAEPVIPLPTAELDGDVARSVTAALEGVRASEEAVAAGTEASATESEAPAPVLVAAAAVDRSAEPSFPRSAAAARPEDGRRSSEVPATRDADAVVRPEATVAPVAGGDAQLSQDRSGNPQLPSAPVVEATRAESPAPVPAAADAASASAPIASTELAGRSSELAAQARGEGVAVVQTLRSPEPMSPMQTGRPMPASAPDSIAVQADWLANRGGGTARIVLHPPELGEIAIRVTVRNQAVDVVMVAHTALAHQVAEDQSDRLSQAFASRDLRLEQFEVRRGDPSDASSTGQFGSSDAGARERERAQEQAQADRGGAGPGGSRRGAAGVEAVVAPPRNASNGRAAGIDLRI